MPTSTKRTLILKKLLTTSHINVPERKQLDTQPTFAELIAIAEGYFTTEKFLPGTITKWSDTELNYEGYSLEKRGDVFILHLQQAGVAPYLTGSRDKTYVDLRQALRDYLQWEFRFNIDGVEILIQ